MGSRNTIESQMADILKEVAANIDEAIEEGLKVAPKLCTQQLRANSPKKSGDYAKGWRIKRENKGLKTATVYNATMPGLTHLLEKGHVIRNKKGEYGRAPAHPHMKPAEEAAVKLFEETISRKTDNL